MSGFREMRSDAEQPHSFAADAPRCDVHHSTEREVYEGIIRVWDAETAEQLSTVLTDKLQHYWPLVFSPDGKILVGRQRLSSGNIEVWQIEDSAPLFTLNDHTGAVSEYAFSPDSKIFVSGGDKAGTIILWDIKTGNQLNRLTGQTASISALAFSADSKTLASGSGNEIRLWDADTSNLIGILDTGLNIQALAFSPDGKRLACGTEDGRIQVWALGPTFQVPSTFTGHQGSIINVLMFSPDGKTLASGSGDGTILLWNIGQ